MVGHGASMDAGKKECSLDRCRYFIDYADISQLNDLWN